MSANIRFLDSDATTVITVVNEGNLATPSTSAGHKIYVNNNGDQTAQSITVSLEQIGTNDGYLYGQLAPDSGGSPGAYSSGPLSLSNIAASGMTAIWFRELLVAGLTPDNNPRRYNILVDYGTI